MFRLYFVCRLDKPVLKAHGTNLQQVTNSSAIGMDEKILLDPLIFCGKPEYYHPNFKLPTGFHLTIPGNQQHKNDKS